MLGACDCVYASMHVRGSGILGDPVVRNPRNHGKESQ